MEFINTDGMSFLGPGSEWFWTAVTAGVTLATLLAIYRQVLLQRGLKEAQQSEDLAREWDSERLLRARLAIALVHHPVLDAQGAVVTSTLTNIDVHDLARSAKTYGCSDFFVVHPIEAQRTLASRIVEHWTTGSSSAACSSPARRRSSWRPRRHRPVCRSAGW